MPDDIHECQKNLNRSTTNVHDRLCAGQRTQTLFEESKEQQDDTTDKGEDGAHTGAVEGRVFLVVDARDIVHIDTAIVAFHKIFLSVQDGGQSRTVQADTSSVAAHSVILNGEQIARGQQQRVRDDGATTGTKNKEFDYTSEDYSSHDKIVIIRRW